jgi:hypothetical protein
MLEVVVVTFSVGGGVVGAGVPAEEVGPDL